MQQVSELTAQQKALLGEYKQRWQQVAYSTQPINQEKATQAIKAIYKQLSKFEDFEIYFFDSPVDIANLSFLYKIYPNENWCNPRKLSNLIKRVKNRLLAKNIGQGVFQNIVIPLIDTVGKQLEIELWHYLEKELFFRSGLNGLIPMNLKDREKLSPTQYCSVKFKVIALAPLTPQFWGEMTKDFGFLPPELGGRGGQCRDKRT